MPTRTAQEVKPIADVSPSAPRRLGAAIWLHRWLALAAVTIIVGGAWYGAKAFLGPAIAVDHVERGQIVETIVASGNVLTPFRVNIASQIVGTVRSVLVDEGQTVTKGQPLLALEDRELKANVAQATDAVAAAQARVLHMNRQTLPSARDSVAQAQATLLDEQKTFDRTSELATKGYATRQALDDAQKTLDVARAQVKADDLMVYTSSPGGSDYVLAQTAYHQARAALDTSIAQLGHASIAAPRAGVLITRNVEEGTVVQPGAALLVLAPSGEMQLALEIDERNLGKIGIGQTAVGSADAYPRPDQRFPSVVSYINPGIDISRGSVEVKLTVDNPPAFLRQDMTVSVDIEVARSDNALALPARAVHDATTGSPWVMGIRDGRALKLPVTLGLIGDTATEIKTGLALGDAAIPVASGILVGQRVRAIEP
jgi:HlyD family secretion protein